MDFRQLASKLSYINKRLITSLQLSCLKRLILINKLYKFKEKHQTVENVCKKLVLKRRDTKVSKILQVAGSAIFVETKANVKTHITVINVVGMLAKPVKFFK